MRRTAVPLALSTHPGPAVAVTVISIGLGIGASLDPWRVAVLALAVLLNQASVGLSNDWIDADRDRAVRRADKPVAVGAIGVGVVRASAWITAVASVLLTLSLSAWAALAQLVFIASAWSYNAALKKTAFSVVPYIVSFGLLPSIVTLSRAEPAAAAPWAFAAGALLGVAAHFANVLPDLDDDRATGVRGLPHRFGRRAAAILTYLVLLLAAASAFLGTGGLSYPLAGIGLALTVALAGIGISIAARPTRWHFRLIIIAAIVIVVVLASAGDRLLWR